MKRSITFFSSALEGRPPCRPSSRPTRRSALQYFVYLQLSILLASSTYAADPRADLKNGIRLYNKDAYEDAAKTFESAAGQAKEEKLDEAVPFYNQGNALMKLGKFDDAMVAYQKALSSPNISLQSRTYFNLGNSLLGKGLPVGQNSNAADYEKKLEQAMDMYISSILLDPTDEDPKYNYEIAIRIKQGFLEAIKQAERLLDTANRMVDQYDYLGVRNLLTQELPKHQLAMSLRTELNDRFSEMIENVNKVLIILEEAPISKELLPDVDGGSSTTNEPSITP